VRRNLPDKFPGLPKSFARKERGERVSARLEIARTSTDDAPHWRNLANLSPLADLPEADRRAAWMKVRQEAQNNPHLRGMLKTLVNTIVGKGPRLQMGFTLANGEPDVVKNKRVEVAFATWCRKVKWGKKLRLLMRTFFVDGEGIAVATTSRKLPTAVKLSFKNVESEMLTTPLEFSADEDVKDGIRFDDEDEPQTYYFLNRHPGDARLSSDLTPKPIDAEYVCHLFDPERPGQVRGYSQFAGSVQPLADVRRYGRAVIGAAETAANIVGTLESELDEGSDGDEDVEAGKPWEEIELPRKGFLTTPAGVTAKAFTASQPTTTYEAFKDTNVADAGRGPGLPRNLALGNSKDANFSSAKLDHLIYWLLVAVIQDDVGIEVCDWILGLWLDEATLASPELVADIGTLEEYPHTWLWGGRESENIVDEANAFTALYDKAAITLAEWYGRRGMDWREQVKQWGVEQAELAKLRPAAPPSPPMGTEDKPASTPATGARQNQEVTA
jgi:capsid protein